MPALRRPAGENPRSHWRLCRPSSPPGLGMFSGEGGIRTRGTVARTHDFQSCTFGHSVTSPGHFPTPHICRGRRWSNQRKAGHIQVRRPFRPKSASLERALLGRVERAQRRGLWSCGEKGIRTLGTLAGTPDFESGTFGHSVISPRRNMSGRGGAVNACTTEKRHLSRVSAGATRSSGARRAGAASWPSPFVATGVTDWLPSLAAAEATRAPLPVVPGDSVARSSVVREHRSMSCFAAPKTREHRSMSCFAAP